MFAFTSWSYVHHIRPGKEVLYIDADRHVPVHETLTSSWEGRAFEIDFADYVEVEPGQWAPLSIRIESKDYFTCEYRFQLVAGKHWMLKEVVSWFKPEEKSRGVIEDVRIDGDRAQLDDALRQVQATRTLFARRRGARTFGSTWPPCRSSWAEPMRLGPYEVRVTMQDDRTGRRVRVDGRSKRVRHGPRLLPRREGPAPLRPVHHAQGAGRGAAGLGRDPGLERLAGRCGRSSCRRVMPPPRGRPIAVVPLRWGEPIAVNIPDAQQGSLPGYGEKEPRKALTRAFQVRAERNGDGTAKVTLDVVSIDGMHEFYLDLAAALLGPSGEVVGSGGLSTDLRVESKPVEQRFEIALGKTPRGRRSRRSSRSASPPAR